jgi:hypothetical protein
MTVYLVPVGGSRYQLYVEMSAEDAVGATPQAADSGWVSRQVHKFRAMLVEAEQERLRRESGLPEQGSGPWRWIMRRIAEAVAEQRLLWHLRHRTSADVLHPDDLDRAGALREVRAEFTRDVAKHRRWMAIDGLITAVTGPLLFFVPGPNIVSWYFLFRAIGHFLSWRGALRGLTRVEWSTTPSAPLTAVRSSLALPMHERRIRLLEIGESLGLSHLAGFVDRVFARRGD